MILTISKKLTLNVFIISTLSMFGYADNTTNLPVSTQLTESNRNSTITKIDNIEILSEVTIDASSVTTSNTNPQLKSGIACDDENLEPAELGPDFVELPMAKTEPCDSTGCNNLSPAELHADNYKNLPMAKTTKLCDK